MWISRKNVVIAGDFNADQLSSNCNGSKLAQICQSFNFRNVIKSPTRIAATSCTLLDLIFTNNLPKIFKSGVIDFCIADHKFVYSVFMLKKRNDYPILKRVNSFKKLMNNKANFKHDLETAPWWVCSVFDDGDDIAWAWESMYKDILGDYVICRDAKIRNFSLPCMNSDIRKAMNKRYKLLRACDGSPLSADTWSNCCGASVASEQQHKQDLRRMYKREYDSRIHHFLPECIAPSTRMHCAFLPECIAPSTRMYCATNNTRGCVTVVLSSFFAWIAID